jgi:hypothetical protein
MPIGLSRFNGLYMHHIKPLWAICNTSINIFPELKGENAWGSGDVCLHRLFQSQQWEQSSGIGGHFAAEYADFA